MHTVIAACLGETGRLLVTTILQRLYRIAAELEMGLPLLAEIAEPVHLVPLGSRKLFSGEPVKYELPQLLHCAMHHFGCLVAAHPCRCGCR